MQNAFDPLWLKKAIHDIQEVVTSYFYYDVRRADNFHHWETGDCVSFSSITKCEFSVYLYFTAPLSNDDLDWVRLKMRPHKQDRYTTLEPRHVAAQIDALSKQDPSLVSNILAQLLLKNPEAARQAGIPTFRRVLS